MPVDAPYSWDAIVLGGGITGLVSAWKLAEAGHRVALVEKSEQPGGMIKTLRDGDWLLDVGPNSIGFREDDDIHDIIRQLGIENDLILRPVRESDRYIWRRGQLRRVPVSPLHLFRRNALSRRMVTRAAWRMWQPHTLPDQDISIGAYFSTTVGRKMVNHVLAPAMAGIYAADPFCLSMKTIMPRLYEASRGRTSLGAALRKMKHIPHQGAPVAAKGRRVMGNFSDGMHTLIDALAAKAKEAGVEILPSFVVSQLSRADEKHWRVVASDGRALLADHVVCALPAPAAANLLSDVAPQAAGILAQVRYAPMIMAHVGVQENECAINYQGFGYLAVRDAGVRSLGMIWNDRMFPGRAPDGHRLFTVFLGGQIDKAACDLSDEQVVETISADLRRAMNWTGHGFAMHRIVRMREAIPLMEVGHADRINDAQKLLPEGLVLSGNYVTGVSVPACIRAGVCVVEKLKRQA